MIELIIELRKNTENCQLISTYATFTDRFTANVQTHPSLQKKAQLLLD